MSHPFIPLTDRSGTVVAHAQIDETDHAWLSQWQWRFGCRGYAVRSENSRTPRCVYMHREILGISQAGRLLQGDHINRNRLDNRKANLRIVDPAGQAQNHSARRGSTSPFRGVSWHSVTGKWQARVGLDGRQHHLGVFSTEEEAARIAALFRIRYMPYATDKVAL